MLLCAKGSPLAVWRFGKARGTAASVGVALLRSGDTGDDNRTS
jgi:hypothetical protein